MQLIDTKAKI